jgi:penicillin amidase
VRRATLLALAGGVLLAAPAAADVLRAEAVLPPGQSGYVSIPGVASGTGDPHLTDQTDLFKNFELRPFGFDQPATSTEAPAAGVRIERDAYGVPNVTGSTDRNAWFGVGYAAAEDRLFELELFRRAAEGRLAEILGSTYLDDDLIARRDYYTDAEVDAMVARVPPLLQQRFIAYRDGINAYIDYLQTHPSEIPGEFAALGVPLTQWNVRDSARIGILLARTVPSGDGNELENAQALERIGPKGFDRLAPVRTKGSITTIKRGEGKFKAQPGRSRKDEHIGFKKSQKYLKGIDVKGAEGPGTTTLSGDPQALSSDADGEAPGADLTRILPHGGSFMWAISDRKRHRGYLFNGPQLGFAIPELFFEFEIHSPLQDARGVSAAGVPLVAIGHNENVAWGYTSGLSDEDDLFAVKTDGGDETYDFKGTTRQMDCRNEKFDYKTPPTSLPGLIDDPGLPAGSVTERICRTSQGPVQFRGDGVAYARRYAIWNRELETFTGLTQLMDSDNIGDVDKAMRHVTWNENVMATDSRGHIGYWHPGLHQLKPKRWDERLPFPGNGQAEWRGLLPRSKTPHVVNPKRNWLANWNNLPSVGWTNGDGPARERENGNFHRIRLIQSLVRKVAKHPSYERSRKIELTSGTTAQQFPFVDKHKVRKAEKRRRGIGRATLKQLMRWDGDYTKTGSDGTIDPGVSIWEEFKHQLERRVLKPYGPGAKPLAGGTSTSHEYDITPGEAIGLRDLGARGYAQAAKRTGNHLSRRFGTENPAEWRAPRLMYDIAAQGAAAPPDLPFFDRGTWSQSLSMGKP